jgi:hypothetical protein
MSLRWTALSVSRFVTGSVALLSVSLAACGMEYEAASEPPCNQAHALLPQAPALVASVAENIEGEVSKKLSYQSFAEALGRGYTQCPSATRVTLGFCDGTSYQYVHLERSSGERQDYFYMKGVLQGIRVLPPGGDALCGGTWYGSVVPCTASPQSVIFCSKALP